MSMAGTRWSQGGGDSARTPRISGCSPKRNNATAWTLWQHIGTVLKCPELQEHTEPPIDCTRPKHLKKLISNVLNWIEMKWIAFIQIDRIVNKQTLFSQMQTNLFTPTWMQPIRVCSHEIGEPTASFQDLGRCFQNWIVCLKSCIRGCMLTTRLHDPIPCIL